MLVDNVCTIQVLFVTKPLHYGPDLTSRVVKFCMGIAICQRQKFGQVWGSQLLYQKSQENSAARRHPGRIAITWKIGIILRCILWAVGGHRNFWEVLFRRFVWGK